MVSTDPLDLLRAAVVGQNDPALSTSNDAKDTVTDIAKAKFAIFRTATGPVSVPLDAATRFRASGQAANLRSIIFAWQRKDDAVQAYITEAQKLNDALAAPGNAGGSVQNLVFAERQDLQQWLQALQTESEYIVPPTGDAEADSSILMPSASGLAPGRMDERLQAIYAGERTMLDHDTMLHGSKAQDWSWVLDIADQYYGRSKAKPSEPAPSAGLNPSGPNAKKPARAMQPIILISPSATSLVRMTNAKLFLENGQFVPPNSAAAGSSAGASILHTQRLMPSFDAHRPLRFILVESIEHFKPDYWQRVVAVFTTGQTWQFKPYKWTTPQDLFAHVLGVYVGWAGEPPQAEVRSWGHSVKVVSVDKWSPTQGTASRWRDREVVEQIWTAIEESMKRKGWTKDGPGTV
ncbi:RNA polymerase II-associated protein [Trichodelitschia bisporula]|uniref:RNA polymerase II-associated protein n=1 Tax=Trichodelitschia bisporula TaxID=703511 RepID=A0A6G1HIL2_9PEZI|nr:RNA polymerase II-associated protein [Trichodelitschia bisporula]